MALHQTILPTFILCQELIHLANHFRKCMGLAGKFLPQYPLVFSACICVVFHINRLAARHREDGRLALSGKAISCLTIRASCVFHCVLRNANRNINQNCICFQIVIVYISNIRNLPYGYFISTDFCCQPVWLHPVDAHCKVFFFACGQPTEQTQKLLLTDIKAGKRKLGNSVNLRNLIRDFLSH